MEKCRCFKFYKYQNSYNFCPDCGRDLRNDHNYTKIDDYLNQPTPYADEGGRLFEIRRKKRIVMRKMAKITGYKPSELSSFEHGRIKIPDGLLTAYEKAEGE